MCIRRRIRKTDVLAHTARVSGGVPERRARGGGIKATSTGVFMIGAPFDASLEFSIKLER